eukprot:3131892-Pyramimonas_sp.AAC.1
MRGRNAQPTCVACMQNEHARPQRTTNMCGQHAKRTCAAATHSQHVWPADLSVWRWVRCTLRCTQFHFCGSSSLGVSWNFRWNAFTLLKTSTRSPCAPAPITTLVNSGLRVSWTFRWSALHLVQVVHPPGPVRPPGPLPPQGPAFRGGGEGA